MNQDGGNDNPNDQGMPGNNANFNASRTPSAGGDPNSTRNVLSNIGTPSFNFSQIPQHILQSLSSSQLRMIQQRHEQLLMSRMQQQRMQQSGNAVPPGAKFNNRNASTGGNMTNPNNNNNNSNMSPGTTQANMRRADNASQPPNAQLGNNSNNNMNQPQGTLNLPPQIAQLPPMEQLQVLNTLKQQAILKKNPAAVTTINMALQQLQQHIQQQLQQQSGGPDIPQQNMMQNSANMMNNSPANANSGNKGTGKTAQQANKKKASHKKAAGAAGAQNNQTVPPATSKQAAKKSTTTETTKAKRKSKAKVTKPQSSEYPSASLPNQGVLAASIAALPLPELELPKLELPKFQIVQYNPEEQPLPSKTYWSSNTETPSTDTLLYEQILDRDEKYKEARRKESQGYEPFSIYGFSNKEYISKQFHNLKYYQDLKSTRMESITLTSKNMPAASIWGSGYAGYGNGNTNTMTNIIPEHVPEGMRKNFIFDDEVVYKDVMSENEYSARDQLVPIRLEFDQERDKFFLRDTLLWNKNDKLVNINDFVKDMLMDYRFDETNIKTLTHTISRSIKDQILEFQPNPYVELNQCRTGGDDLRIKIKLDIVVGQNQLIDQFEWDISNTENDAEEFAENMCQELQLPGEFITAISHAIREQVHMYHKSLALLGYTFDGQPVEDDDIRSRLLSVVTLDDIFRQQSETKHYTPNLLQISAAEFERLDRDKDRDTRRKRRQGRFNRRGYGLINAASSSNVAGAAIGGSSALSGMPVLNKGAAVGGSLPGTGAAISHSANGPVDIPLPDLSDLPRTFRTPIPTTILPGGVDFGPSVKSFDVKTTVEYRPRPEGPKPPPPPCYIIDNNPGKSLLLCIRLKKKDADGQTDPSTQDDKGTGPKEETSMTADKSLAKPQDASTANANPAAPAINNNAATRPSFASKAPGGTAVNPQ